MRNLGFTTYGLLARHQIVGAYRAFAQRSNAYVRVILAVLGLYLAYSLVLGGWRFGQIARYLLDIPRPLDLVNDYLIAAAFALFGLRFLFGRTPRFRATPYLHLPIPRRSLVRYFQASSLVSLHNLYPVVFVIPFWLNEVRRINPSHPGSTYWLLGVLALLVASTWLNSWLRAILSYRARLFALIVAGTWGTIAADQVAGTFYVNDLSRFVFGRLLEGDVVVLAALVAVAALSGALASRRLYLSLRNISSPPGSSRRVYREITLLQDLGPVGQLLVLELKMIWRNRRPRHNLMLSTVFSTVYIVALLLTPDIGDSILVQAVVGLFASGGFALNYGQLMFAWESSFFDGLMSRSISAQTLIRAKYLLLQLSCVAFFLMSLPIFWVLRPDLVLLHIAFTIYNAGITSLMIMVLAVLNRRRVELWRSGSFFNYEGFSLLHWLWIFPISVPPLAIVMSLPQVRVHAALLVALTGLFGVLMTPLLVNILSERFLKRRYAMLAGFRIT